MKPSIIFLGESCIEVSADVPELTRVLQCTSEGVRGNDISTSRKNTAGCCFANVAMMWNQRLESNLDRLSNCERAPPEFVSLQYSKSDFGAINIEDRLRHEVILWASGTENEI